MVRRTEKGVRRTEKRVRRTEKGVRRTEKGVRRTEIVLWGHRTIQHISSKALKDSLIGQSDRFCYLIRQN